MAIVQRVESYYASPEAHPRAWKFPDLVDNIPRHLRETLRYIGNRILNIFTSAIDSIGDWRYRSHYTMESVDSPLSNGSYLTPTAKLMEELGEMGPDARRDFWRTQSSPFLSDEHRREYKQQKAREAAESERRMRQARYLRNDNRANPKGWDN